MLEKFNRLPKGAKIFVVFLAVFLVLGTLSSVFGR